MAWQDLLCLQVSTVVLRASTDNTLDDLERAVDDGVNAYKVCSTVGCHDIAQSSCCHMLHVTNP